jgi:hypothetical protein
MDRPTAGDPSETLLWADRWAVPFSHDPETVLHLVDTLPEAGTERSNDCLVLMSRILDEARMNNENEEPGASHFFQVLTAGLTERAEAGELDAETCFGLCQAYLRASLTPPDQLRKAPDVFEALTEDEGLALPDVADLAEGLVPDGSTPFETYTELREIVGAMPAQVTTAFLTQIIWAKDRLVLSRGDYHWQHEPCLYAVKKTGKGHWAGDRKQTTLWQIANKDQDADTVHGTQKPVECMRRPILNNSSPGQAVYELFMGSGTTLIAAETTGRVCYGIELNPAYVDVAVARWQQFTGNQAILEGSDQAFDALKTERAAA